MPPQPKKRPPLSEITKRFHLPLLKAAEDLGICQTLLKKFCRQYGINRWPYRKIKSLFMQGPNPSEQIQMNNKVQAYVDSSLEDEEIESEEVLDQQLRNGSINPSTTTQFAFSYPVPQPPPSPFTQQQAQQQPIHSPPIQTTDSGFFFQNQAMTTKISPAMSQVVQNISQQHFGQASPTSDAAAILRRRSRTVAVVPSQDKKLVIEQQQQVPQKAVSPPVSPRAPVQQQSVPQQTNFVPQFKLEDTNTLYTAVHNSTIQKQKSWGGFPSNFHQKQDVKPVTIDSLAKPLQQSSPVQSLFTMAQGPSVIPTKAPSPTQDEVMHDLIPLRREKRSRSVLGASNFKDAMQPLAQQQQQPPVMVVQEQQQQVRSRSSSLNNGMMQPQSMVVQPSPVPAQQAHISVPVQQLNSSTQSKVPPISSTMTSSFFGNPLPDKGEPKDMDPEMSDSFVTAVPNDMSRVRRARTVAAIGHHPLQVQNSGLQQQHLPNKEWEQIIASRVASPPPSITDAPPSPLSSLHTSLAASLPHQNSPVHSPVHSPPVMSPAHSPLSSSPVQSYMPMPVPKQDSNVMRSKSHGSIIHSSQNKSGGLGFKLPSLSELLGSIERHVPIPHTQGKNVPKASLQSYKL